MEAAPDSPAASPVPPRGPARRGLAVWLGGRIGLDDYWSLAERLAWEVSEPAGRPPTLLVCELAPAITIGRAGSRADVLLSAEELAAHRLDLRFVGRGGGAVLHAPGQACVALFGSLDDLGLSAATSPASQRRSRRPSTTCAASRRASRASPACSAAPGCSPPWAWRCDGAWSATAPS
jgi:hypothetical protein